MVIDSAIEVLKYIDKYQYLINQILLILNYVQFRKLPS